MSIKRTLFALIAMMLLPAVAAAQLVPPPAPTPPPITPAEGTAVIAVVKDFLDNNTEDTVTVSITCSSGSISPTTLELGDGEGGSFVIDNLPETGPHTCTVTETGAADYDGYYLCFPGGAGADTDCQNPNVFAAPVATSCQFNDVQAYDGNGVDNENVGYCAIFNLPAPVDVDVTKVWETFGAEQGDFDPDVDLNLVCEPTLAIVDGTKTGTNRWEREITLADGDGDFDDEDGKYVGEGVAEFEVIPWWFPTSADPDDQLYTECYVEEDASDNSAVEVDNGCGDSSSSAKIEVAAGMGDECTITNTVFFEGIPTLSQYGMAIMALLMLGVGFIGMRRFV